MPKPFDIADIILRRAEQMQRADLMMRARALTFDIRSCKSCRGNLFVHVRHGTMYETDTAEERALAWHTVECPDCLSNIMKVLGEGR